MFVAEAAFEGLKLWEKLLNPSKKIEKAVKAFRAIKSSIDVINRLRKVQ